MTHEERILRQIELERGAVGDGKDRYWKRQNDAMSTKTMRGNDRAPQFENTKPGQILARTVVNRLADEIDAWIEGDGKVSRRYASVLPVLKQLDTDVLAYITAKVCINACGHSDGLMLPNVASEIANIIQDELAYMALEKWNKRYYEKVVRHQRTKKHMNREKRGIAVKAILKQKDVGYLELETDEGFKLGTLLIGLFADLTGYLYFDKQHGKNDTSIILRPTPQLLEWVKQCHDRNELLEPVLYPMVAEPRPWTTPTSGGYYTPHFHAKMVKGKARGYIEELTHIEMPRVYEALNIMQATPWRVNRRVYEVALRVWRTGGDVSKMPKADDEPMPADPENWETLPVEDKVAHRRKRANVKKRNERRYSQRLMIEQKLRLAKKFIDEDRIYFPHALDWRGRAYPIPSNLSPQGDEISRALLDFAEGKKLGTEGWRWLKIHTANCFGVDKVSFAERIKWFDANVAMIYACGTDPYVNTEWQKADKPFMFLRSCMEVAEAQPVPEEFVSYLPVSMDGSNNGIQNFSAMSRDEVGGFYVNLIPTEQPQDFYGVVAKRVSEEVKDDLQSLKDFDRDMARLWDGHVTRNVVKRNCMTIPYGVTRQGMIDQQKSYLEKLEDKGELPPNFSDDLHNESVYMAGVVYKVLRGEGESAGLIKRSFDTMKWLQETASIVSKAGLPVQWTTPVGFYVQQAKHKKMQKRFRAQLGHIVVRSSYLVDKPELDVQEQRRGIAPNFVHSLDASHMMQTILRGNTEGITAWAMVHDSYGTHAADAARLARMLREVFVEQYRPNILKDFARQMREQVPAEAAAGITDPPEWGTLDLEQLVDAEYFFA